MSRINWTDDKLLSRLIHNKSDRSRWDTIHVLRKRPSEELLGKCLEFTKSSDPKIRSIGIDILAQLGLSPRPFLNETLTCYFDLLTTEKNPEVLLSLLYGIGHNNDNLDKVQIEKICSFCNSDNKLIKEGLVSALGFIDDIQVIDILIKLSDDQSTPIRNWATFYIGQGERNTKTIREALWKRIGDKHQETKLEAIAGLAKRKDKRVNEVIKREMIKGEFGTLLFEAIIATKNQEFLPLLQQNLKSIKEDQTINPEWEKDLENCIVELEKLK
ncbi:hypothetical protein [Fluviicola taffensis]|uniref:hypothetical protein n=1 Tax=Fluviicola taffensis TaxID=191579 RepID=UPI0031377ED8